MKIEYLVTAEKIEPGMLEGFFEGWPNPPSPETHLKILHRSAYIVLAVDRDNESRVIGFINAIADNTLSAYIPLLEVLPEYRGNGIGGELVKRMLSRLSEYYMIDLLCLEELAPFYEKYGLKPAHAMAVRNFDKQNGMD